MNSLIASSNVNEQNEIDWLHANGKKTARNKVNNEENENRIFELIFWIILCVNFRYFPVSKSNKWG